MTEPATDGPRDDAKNATGYLLSEVTASDRPLCIDLFCGLGGWAEGFLAEGYDCIGFDIERHDYGPEISKNEDGSLHIRPGGYPGQLVLQDVLTLHGSQFRNAAVIVASPPCQAYSYRAMPWKRAKALPPPSNTLFESCFRIQREASEAAGHHIPMVVENVRGAEKWVGPAAWHFGSFYLWGDTPALMPPTRQRKQVGRNFHFPEKYGIPSPSFHGAAHEPSVQRANGLKGPGGDWFKDGRQGQDACAEGLKTTGHANIRDGHSFTRHLTNQRESDGLKVPGIKLSEVGFNVARKAASAQIAKIPFPLANWIAKVYKPVIPIHTQGEFHERSTAAPA